MRMVMAFMGMVVVLFRLGRPSLRLTLRGLSLGGPSLAFDAVAFRPLALKRLIFS